MTHGVSPNWGDTLASDPTVGTPPRKRGGAPVFLEPFPLTMDHREWTRRAPDIGDDPVRPDWLDSSQSGQGLVAVDHEVGDQAAGHRHQHEVTVGVDPAVAG